MKSVLRQGVLYGAHDRRPRCSGLRIALPHALRLFGAGSLLAMSLGGCVSQQDKKLAFPDPPDPAPAVSAEAQAAPQPLTVQPSAPKLKQTKHKSQKSNTPEKLASADIPDKPVSPSIEPEALIGKGPTGVARLLGVPSSAAQRDASLIWTYESGGCALQVYFYPDLKTSLWHAMQYAGVGRNGDALNSSNPCIRHILAERSNGTD